MQILSSTVLTRTCQLFLLFCLMLMIGLKFLFIRFDRIYFKFRFVIFSLYFIRASILYITPSNCHVILHLFRDQIYPHHRLEFYCQDFTSFMILFLISSTSVPPLTLMFCSRLQHIERLRSPFVFRSYTKLRLFIYAFLAS